MSETVDTQEQQTAAPEAQAQQQANPNELTINDLNAMKVIIDIASSRGAFQPKEMKVVGQTYEKLEAFLAEVQKQAEAAKAAQGQ
jgi:hypothetical protein